MASLLSRIATAARALMRRRTGAGSDRPGGARLPGPSRTPQGRTPPPLTGRQFARQIRSVGLGQLAAQSRSAPPPLTPEQFLRQLERVAAGEQISPAEADQIERQMPQFTPPPPPPPSIAAGEGGEEEYDEIEILGRDLGYHVDDFADLIGGQIVVSSSNVYAYYYQPESRFSGILYVTFLAPAPKGQPRTDPGPTYAYYSVTRAKYERFRRQADGSAGEAVWDHLRVRGTLWGHQQPYRLIHVSGEYVPRRATARGFRTRYVRPIGPPSTGRGGPLPREPGARARELRRQRPPRPR